MRYGEKFQIYLDISNELKSLGLNGLQSQDIERICKCEHGTPVSNFWETIEYTKVPKDKEKPRN